MTTRRALLKSLGIGPGGGTEVTLQETVASEVIPLIRQKCFVRQVADKAKTLVNMTKPKIRVPKLVRAQGAYSVKAGQPAPEFRARMDSVPLEPEKIMAWLPIDSEVFEDSTIKDIEGILKEEMAKEFAQAEELAFLLGDTDIHHDDGDPRNVFDGLLKQAAATPHVYDATLDDTEGTTPVSNIIRAIANLGIYGRNKRELVVMVGTGWEQALIRNKAFQTMSAYAFGSGAGIFSGEIGRIGGAPVVATTFLDAQPGESTSKAFVMHQSCFAIGDWQKFSINTYNEILSQTDQVAIRARERIAFTVRYAEAICEILNPPAFL
ncbi:phage major capsid protein [Leptothoe spongobia]|uniref:Phage major capsid protein n=1 Tax=Leptothoe spongobia TAU-MAC 1115 TaxID=1967444 RepID=A0A947GKE2_9CYAN|nr:phage major capsid protein [Leptothoe spongobia]MBT9316302.1 phage major capsid protein [Leptothoe spongobia TAU-MAC 1115]